MGISVHIFSSRNLMVKEIVTCGECEYYTLNSEGMGMCKHPNALPFPGVNDFCSKGEYSEKKNNLIYNEALLKRVYDQRRG